VAYLLGDTGITADQEDVVRGYYNAKLVVMNIGDTFTTGPAEAAYVINDLVKPTRSSPRTRTRSAPWAARSVRAARTEAFIKAVKVPVHVPLSAR
jgi:L-ascorbate metabolism protein UlaG (beta-lactamase superfamily)